MYHAVCREYIPNGSELDNEGVDEVWLAYPTQHRRDVDSPHTIADLSCFQYAAGWSPLHRVGLPIDIARVVCFLASQDGEWINGKVLGIDGGACM